MKQGCKRDAVAKGYCSTHYRYAKVRAREKALKDVIVAIDKLGSKRPELRNVLEAIVKESRGLYSDFQPKKVKPADQIAQLQAEVAELRKAIKTK